MAAAAGDKESGRWARRATHSAAAAGHVLGVVVHVKRQAYHAECEHRDGAVVTGARAGVSSAVARRESITSAQIPAHFRNRRGDRKEGSRLKRARARELQLGGWAAYPMAMRMPTTHGQKKALRTGASMSGMPGLVLCSAPDPIRALSGWIDQQSIFARSRDRYIGMYKLQISNCKLQITSTLLQGFVMVATDVDVWVDVDRWV